MAATQDSPEILDGIKKEAFESISLMDCGTTNKELAQEVWLICMEECEAQAMSEEISFSELANFKKTKVQKIMTDMYLLNSQGKKDWSSEIKLFLANSKVLLFQEMTLNELLQNLNLDDFMEEPKKEDRSDFSFNLLEALIQTLSLLQWHVREVMNLINSGKASKFATMADIEVFN